MVEMMADRKRQIAVVGAGIIGCSVAAHISDVLRDRAVVSMISEEFTPNTTGDAASGLLIPFDVGKEKTSGLPPTMHRWIVETAERMNVVYQSKGPEAGVALVHGYFATNTEFPDDPWFASIVPGFRKAEPAEVKRLPPLPKDCKVFAATAFTLDCQVYLPWLMEQFKANGGVVVRRKVTSLEELASFDVVINCSGIGSLELTHDSALYPVQGEGIIVHAPWIHQFLIVLERGLHPVHMTYAFPKSHNVYVGGTAVPNSMLCETHPDTKEEILDRVTKYLPSLARAQVLEEVVGIRPARSVVRFEVEKHEGSDLVVIHCYGHGGKGLNMHWGSALDVGRMVEQLLLNPTSKL